MKFVIDVREDGRSVLSEITETEYKRLARMFPQVVEWHELCPEIMRRKNEKKAQIKNLPRRAPSMIVK